MMRSLSVVVLREGEAFTCHHLRSGHFSDNPSHLKKPGPQLGVDEDIVSVALKAVLIVVDHSLHRLEGVDDELVHVTEESGE